MKSSNVSNLSYWYMIWYGPSWPKERYTVSINVNMELEHHTSSGWFYKFYLLFTFAIRQLLCNCSMVTKLGNEVSMEIFSYKSINLQIYAVIPNNLISSYTLSVNRGTIGKVIRRRVTKCGLMFLRILPCIIKHF